LSQPGWRVEPPVFELPPSATGVSIAANVATLNSRISEHLGEPRAKAAFITCAADARSYLLNSRGYNLPYASSHVGCLFVGW
ncbi:X-Pro aminopeptidase, partial [Burkholderia pseudomallei]